MRYVKYDHKWHDEYLQKEGDHTVQVDTYDRTYYFPPAAVQEQLQTITAASKVAAPHILKDVTLWEASAWEASAFDNTTHILALLKTQ